MMMKKSIIWIVCLGLMSCDSTESSNNDNLKRDTATIEAMKVNNEQTFPLKKELDAKKANFELKASDEKKQKYAEGIQSVIDHQIVENALQVGDNAPDFSLTNADGNIVTLYETLEKGPVILMWYRGGWCPYCNITLHYMQENLVNFEKYGANLLALTPELPDSSLSTKEKNELAFEVLSDLNNEVAKEYNVVFKLTEDVAELYEKGFGLSQYNGNADNELPLAATYLIGKDKVIKYAFLDSDYRNRAEPSEILKALANL